jgi:hypothetical protein
VAFQQGDDGQATSLYKESLTLYQQLGDKRSIAECLEGLAEVAGAQGHPVRAIRLCGAADALRDLIGAPRGPDDRSRYERITSAARTQLDEPTITALRAEGLAIPLEQVIADALERKASGSRA